MWGWIPLHFAASFPVWSPAPHLLGKAMVIKRLPLDCQYLATKSEEPLSFDEDILSETAGILCFLSIQISGKLKSESIRNYFFASCFA